MILLTLIVLIFVAVESYCRSHKKSLIEVLKPNWYKDVTRFPEEDFGCKQGNCDEYENRVQRGKLKMLETSVVLTGLCINVEGIMDRIIARTEYIGSHFKDYRVVIFENDSRDKSRELLLEWEARNPKVHIMRCPEDPMCRLRNQPAVYNGPISEKRMQLMTDYRNRCLSYVRGNYSNFDCICMMDLDLKGPISMSGVANSFGYYDEWDAISGYGLNGPTVFGGIPMYYDTLAYKDNMLGGDDVFDTLPLFYKMQHHDVGDSLLRVKSGFAGIAFYRMEVLTSGVNYTPIDNNFVCEHVTFHKNMISQGYPRIYINPSMVLLTGAQGNVDHYPLY